MDHDPADQAVEDGERGPNVRGRGVRLVGVFLPWQAVVAILVVVVGLTAGLVTARSDRGTVDVRTVSNNKTGEALPDASNRQDSAGAHGTESSTTSDPGQSHRGSGSPRPPSTQPPVAQNGLPTTSGPGLPATTTSSPRGEGDPVDGTSPSPTTMPTTSTTAPRRRPPSILGKIVFMSDRAVYGTSHDYDIWVMDADGRNPKNLTNHFGSDSVPDLSPDGKRIVWLRWVGSGHHVMVMDSDGTNQTEITRYPGSYQYPRWSPDGQRILYTVSGGGLGSPSGSLHTMASDGSDDREVFASSTIPIRSAAWAPDGKRVVIDTNNSSSAAKGLWVVNLADRSAARIFGDEAISPAWSPTGDRIAFSAGVGFSHIFTVKPDGTGAAQLTTGPGQDQGGPAHFDPAWSPDGSRIAFMLSQPNYDIWDMAADGTDARNLTNSPADDQQASF